MSKWTEHVERWKNCQLCKLCEGRARIVLARGTVPCDVLFVGEAPGESENALGRPFVGPAGKLLDWIVRQSLDPLQNGQGNKLRVAFTNLVACIPRDDEGYKAGEPLPEEVMACKPRLEEFILLASPKMVVCVGSLARDWLSQPTSSIPLKRKHRVILQPGVKLTSITHPSAILRMNEAQRGLEIRRCVVQVKTAAEELS